MSKKVSEKEKIMFVEEMISILLGVISATEERCSMSKKKLGYLTKIRDEEQCVQWVDQQIRDCKWLSDRDKEFLEIDGGDPIENEEYEREPSCAIVNDVFLYIEKLARIMTDPKI